MADEIRQVELHIRSEIPHAIGKDQFRFDQTSLKKNHEEQDFRSPI